MVISAARSMTDRRVARKPLTIAHDLSGDYEELSTNESMVGMHGLKNLDRVGVSIVICCFNSEQRIGKTLEYLSKQRDCDSIPWEIVVIDNVSTDNTVAIANAAWKTFNLSIQLRIVAEPRKGTMYARQRGISSANFRYLLFCDDDNWLHDLYLRQAYDSIVGDEGIAAVGGQGVLVFEEGFSPPTWIVDFSSGYGAGPQGKQDGDTTFDKGCLYTAGTILDRIWLDRLFQSGFEPSLTGRDGKTLMAGEDTELTYALKLIGAKLHYKSALTFRHYMPRSRITWTYLTRLWKSFGYIEYVISPYKIAMRGAQGRSRIITFLVQSGYLGCYSLSAALCFFQEGDSAVLRFYRALGRVSAILNASDKYERNMRLANMLASRKKYYEETASNCIYS